MYINIEEIKKKLHVQCMVLVGLAENMSEKDMFCMKRIDLDLLEMI